MKLRERQSMFAERIAILISAAYAMGYEITLGDAWAQPEHETHKPNSKHYVRLAIDLNLFKNGQYLTETHDHRRLGELWEQMGGIWGGRFEDGNHYEWP